MKTITAITPQVKDKKRVNIFLDGKFFCGLQKITQMTNNLQVGDVVSEKRLSELVFESEYTACVDLAYKYLGRKSHTKMQVILYLQGKNFDNKVIGRVISKLEEYGYLDDMQYAKTYIDIKKTSKGKRMLSAELKLKGVDSKTIEEALETLEDEDINAYNVAKKYIKNKPFDFELKAKAFRYLISKGFSYDKATGALDKISAELKQE